MRVIFPDPDRMVELGYPKLAYVPFLVADDGTYPEEANRYIRERSALEWRPTSEDGSPRFGFKVRATVNSLDGMARRVMEFLLWCESVNPKLDWRNVRYFDEILERWQVGMLDGSASRSGRRLCPGTINSRVSEACYFLTWAAERGYRDDFTVSTKPSSPAAAWRNELQRRDRNSAVRIGELPELEKSLNLPPDNEISLWIESLRVVRGEVIALFAETLMRTGMRVSEATELRTIDFPQKKYGLNGDEWRADWIQAGEVPCKLRMGIKGPKTTRGSKESTKPRTVYIPTDLADRLDYYRCEGRDTLLSRWVEAGRSREEKNKRRASVKTDRFWLGKKGRPLTNSWIRQAWGEIGYWKWSPHIARHYFAVNTIVEYVRDLMAQYQLSKVPSVGWLHGLMAGQIKIILTPLMGHVSEDTTNIYLRAARQRLLKLVEHPAIMWLKECERG